MSGLPAESSPTSALLNVLPFGSCSAHAPIYSLDQQGQAYAVWRSLGLRETSYTHTPGEFIQLTRFLRGELDIDRSLRRFIYSDYQFTPNMETRIAFDSADLALVELCTCDSVVFNGYFLHRNLLVARIVEPILASPVDDGVKRAAKAWFNALINKDEEKQVASAGHILPHLPEMMRDETAIAVLFEARRYREERAELRESLLRFADLLGKPMGYLIHYRNFMPNGRPISWPPKFRADFLSIANDDEIPILDPISLIEKYGFSRVIKEDLVHYREDFIPVLGLEYLGFIDRIQSKYKIERSRISTDADNLSRSLIELHKERLDQHGVDGSGLFAHYKRILEEGRLITRHAIRTAEIVCSLPEFSSYHVLRAGLGELAFLLAKVGKNVLACDPDGRRFKAILAGADRLRAEDEMGPRDLMAWCGVVPEADKQRNACCVAVHCTFNSKLRDKEIVAQLRGYAAILFEPRTLFRMRTTEKERLSIIEAFRDEGYRCVLELKPSDLVFCGRSQLEGSNRSADL